MLKLKLKIHYHNKGPNIKCLLNDRILFERKNILEDQIDIELPLTDLIQTNYFFLEHFEKNPSDALYEDGNTVKDIAVEILEIRFDDILLDRNTMFNQYFFVNWQYGTAPSILKMNCYLGYNGVWQLIFPKDYISWILDILENSALGFGHSETVDENTQIDIAKFKHDFLNS